MTNPSIEDANVLRIAKGLKNIIHYFIKTKKSPEKSGISDYLDSSS